MTNVFRRLAQARTHFSRPSSSAAAAAAAVAAVVAAATLTAGQAFPPGWNDPFEPFTVIGNVHYVGTADLASFLITSDAGHVLLDTGVDPQDTLLLASIARLGYKATDIKLLLNSQAHVDHAAGFAELKTRTGAKLLASPKDAVTLETGGKDDFALGNDGLFPKVKVDEQLKDGQVVTLGSIALTARFTPGHTKGATTWTMTVREKDRDYNVVFASSVGINPGVVIHGNKKYPEIKADYDRTYATLKSLKPDVFLGQHANFFGLVDKHTRLKAGATPNPFIDPAGYRQILETMEAAYRAHP